MNAWVLGSKGNLGQALAQALAARGHRVSGVDRGDFDVRDTPELERRLLAGGYDVVLNAVAFNDVDGAEDPANRRRAAELNVMLPDALARLAARTGAFRLVQYSSDYVFDGSKREGYREDDAPGPLSRYGETKRDCERAVLARHPGAFIIRTARLFGEPGASEVSKPSFPSIMLRLAREKDRLDIVDEEVGSPTHTGDLAAATVALLEGYAPGIYHLVNEGPGVTWYGFAEEFFAVAGVTTPRRPVPEAAFPKPARRPAFARLLNTRGPKLRPRIDAVREFFGVTH